MNDQGVVIVGTGQAGYQVAVSLRSAGFTGRVRLIGDESHLPYQRPPLSKAFLAGTCDQAKITFQDEAFYSKHQIELICGKTVISIDRSSRSIFTQDREQIRYGHLVLALGARIRPIPHHESVASGLLALRTLADAQALRIALNDARQVVIVGGGFLGLEFAAIAAAEGKSVSVIETAPQPMGRAVSTAVADAFRKHHEGCGVSFLFGDAVSEILTTASRVTGVRTASGRQFDAELVVVSIGVLPNVELAERAGLTVDNGIVVDASLQTEDPDISALGDCASFPTRFSTDRCRLESIQNATDQARHLAERLTSGVDSRFDAVPWFWSDQGGLKLQIAGLNYSVDQTVVRGDVEARRFSVYGFRQNRLIAVESVASPADHMVARRLLAGNTTVSPSDVADQGLDLRTLSTVSTNRANPS
jgi:3-phenylpropionate/trans-cinnamate dioxygenase ferredoxin reductase subunit